VKLSAVILAAGASRRMGDAKALLEYGGETFLDRLIGLFDEVCEQVIVVLGHDHDRIRRGAKRDATFVLNEAHQSGQLSSLQCGLRAVSAGAEGVFFTPVDVPGVSGATVRSIAAAFDGTCAVAPAFEGKHGHPVLIPARDIPEFLAARESAREVMHRIAVRFIDTSDPGVVRDVDDAADYADLMREAGA
jgi:CTP:molybdopterin cytidylyltransferase MocA